MSNNKHPTIQPCPNCQRDAIRVGNKITCEACDAIFEIKKTGAAQVKKVGPYADLLERVKKIEGKVFGEPEPEPEQRTEPEPEPGQRTEPEPDDAEDDIL